MHCAVRFIRHRAARFSITPHRIGSSGGRLVSMLGALDGRGLPADPDPVERESAKVQSIVARAAPVDFLTGTNGSFLLGMTRPLPNDRTSAEYRTPRTISAKWSAGSTSI